MANIESWSVVKYNTSVTSATVAKPAGTVAGDLLVVTGLWGSTGATDIPVLPVGFTSRSSAGNLSLRYNIGWKVAGDAEPADYTVTINGAHLCVVSMLRISGWDTANPIPDLVHVNGSSATPISPALTPTADGLLVHVHMSGGNMYTGAFVEDSGYPVGDTGIFLRAALSGNSVANRGMGKAYRAATTGVTVPDVTWDTGAVSGATYRGISFVVASAPGTGQIVTLGSVSEADAVGAVEVQGGVPIPVPVAPPPVESDHVIARDLTTGFDLYLKAPDTQFTFVASTVKTLTSVVLMDHKAGVLATETVTVEAVDLVGGTVAGLQAGDVLTWEDLLYCVYLPSGNDASETLARVLGDWLFAQGISTVAGRAGFMERMNAKAVELGMLSSSFESPHGVRANPAGTNDDVNITTARDMALAIEAAFLDPVIQTIAGAVSRDVTITGANARTISLSHSVELIDGPFNAPAGIRDEGVLASKTGATEFNDNNLVTLWQAPSGHMIAIGTWGASNDGNRYLDNRAIMYGLLRDFPDLDVPPAADPDYDKVVFLAGFESGIVDESSYARTLTNVGAALTTTSPLIGAQSLETFGGTTRVQTADAPELHFGADDFAIEVWFRGKGVVPTDHSVLVSQYDTNSKRSWSLQYDVTNQQLIFWHSTDGVNAFGANFKFADFGITPAVFFNGAPRHIMARRAGPEIALYMNGEKGGQPYNVGATSLYDTDVPMMIGARASGSGVQYPLAGVFDEIRITKGAPRQTATKYTAYGRAFPRAAVAETVIDIAAVTETAAAVGIAAAKTIMLGAVSESENAVAPVIAKSAPLAAVASADAPGLVTSAKTAALPPVAATEATGTVTAGKAASMVPVSAGTTTGVLLAETLAALAAVTETDLPGTIQVTGVAVSYLSFDGIDDYVLIPNHALINSAGPYPSGTVELRFRADTLSAGKHLLYKQGGYLNGVNAYLDGSTLYVGWWANDAGTTDRFFVAGAVAPGEWHHVALRWDSTLNRFDGLLDGVQFGTGSIGGALPTHGLPSSIGAAFEDSAFHDGPYDAPHDAVSFPFDGVIEEVRRWSTYRSDVEITTNKDANLSGAQSGLVALWPLHDGSGTVAADVGGTINIDGTIVGASWIVPSAGQTVVLGSAIETDQVGALGVAKAAMLGAVAETVAAGDAAVGKVATLASVGEADLSTALSIGTMLDLPPVTEADHAGVIQVGTNVVLTLPPVTELDQTGALGVAKAATFGSVAEAAQTRPAGIGKAAALGSAAESSSMLELTTSKAVTVTAVGEAPLSAPATVAKTVLLEWVTEIDLAGEVSGTPVVLRVVSVSVVPALSGTVSIGPAIPGKFTIN